MHRRDIISDDLPKDFDFNADLKLAFDRIENTKSSVFLTGPAGTGKTTFLKYIKGHTRKRAVILAPTGVAALNAGGQTIHSFFKFPPKLIQKDDIRRTFNSLLMKNIDLMIIDEVSMVRVDLMEGVDYALRINRDRDEPFGGVQMLFIGDLFQLCPVVEKEVREVLSKKYATPYFFSAKVFDEFIVKYVELSKIYRQIDVQFIDLLNRIRNKTHTEEDLKLLNMRVRKTSVRFASNKTIVLTTTNNLAGAINQHRLAKLPDKEYAYEAIITGKFDESTYPTDTSLRLKKGAQIILIRNDQYKRWVNGTLAKVAELSDGLIKVDIEGRICDVPIDKWQKIEYDYNEHEDKIKEKIIGSFEQYPIRLAWSMTIHKGQGKTMDKLIIDLGHGAFTHGQVYVSLSRCKTLDGIKLKRPLVHSDVIFDKRIYGFRDRFIALT